MSANPNTHVLEAPVVRGSGGLEWDRLHSEREDICEALLNEQVQTVSETETEARVAKLANANCEDATKWHRELLQARLGKVDEALDRLMSGSYGNCIKCGKWIEDTKLEFDAAIAFCLNCWDREKHQRRPLQNPPNCSVCQPAQAVPTSERPDNNGNHLLSAVDLDTLAPFDSIRLETLNTKYRIFLLDPHEGRALVEGGAHFVEPREARVRGSNHHAAWIGVGHRVEIWFNDKLMITSPVKSVSVEHNCATGPVTGSKLEM